MLHVRKCLYAPYELEEPFAKAAIEKNFQGAASEINMQSSHQRCSVRKGVLRNFSKFTGKHLYHSLLFNKVTGLSLQLH